jgi:hypothetical protein
MGYSETKIYKIVCKDLTITEIYVGHSICWDSRQKSHKHRCADKNSKFNAPVYTFMRKNGGWDNWDMVLIEDYPCENKFQAEQREKYWIETLNATLNSCIPSNLSHSPTDYSKTKIYKIVCKDLTIPEIYIGHSTNLNKRKNEHRISCINENSKGHNRPVYIFMRENGGWDNWDVVSVEDYSCENKFQAEQRERYWIETLNATLNSYIPSRTQQELCEKKRQYDKQHYEKNKEQILQKLKRCREENRENREMMNEKRRKERIEMMNEKKRKEQSGIITCECGLIISKANLSRHKRTKNHQKYLEQNTG